MSEELENSVRDMLKEETWTRATISNYTKNNLSELDAVIEKASSENCEDAIKDICDEQLTHTRDSIMALYISGMIGLRQHSLDNSALVALVDIFEKNHKEALVEYLCNTILDETRGDPQNKFAMRKLAEFYKNSNNDKVWELYEKIVKIDFEEADIARILAERYEQQKNEETAVAYYKKAILRYVNAGNFNSAKEIWSKLCTKIPEEIDFFLLVQRKIAKNISEDKSADLMMDIYKYYKDTAKWDTAIDILKLVLTINPHSEEARNQLIECFRGKYSDRKNVEKFISDSDLDKSFRNVFEAIGDFEKHIAFDTNNFVYHRSWGVGKISKVEGDELTINFGKKNGTHNINLKMAVNALQPLPKNHIWVYKATKTHEILANQVKKDVEWTLKTLINSFEDSCDDKKIKAELVPSILTPGEWTSWHAKAQNELSTNKLFGVDPNKNGIYIVRDKNHPLTKEVRYSNEFRAEKQFFSRIDILVRYLEDDETDKSSEAFSEMFNYFAGFLKSATSVNEQVVASYLIVQEVYKRIKSFTNPAKFTFADMYGDIEQPREMYLALKDTKRTTLRDDFLAEIRSSLRDWDDQFIRLFPTVLRGEMLAALISSGKTDKVITLVQNSFNEYRNYRDAAIYFFSKSRNEEWFKQAGISEEKQLVTLVNIISLCYREIANHVNTTDNKKTIKAACTLLFDDKGKNTMLDYMLANDQSTITRMYTMVNDVHDLDSTYKSKLRNGILNKYSDFKFQEAETKQEAPKGLWVTAKMLEVKKAEADRIEKVELPAVADEVSEARAKGDLKENAEYSSAKEHQHILNSNLTRLKQEIGRAVIFDPTTISTSTVSFGTVVSLHNNIENKDETITILGPWESNVAAGIISYLSPLGNNLLNAKKGDELKFVINDHKYDYTVKSIAAAKI